MRQTRRSRSVVKENIPDPKEETSNEADSSKSPSKSTDVKITSVEEVDEGSSLNDDSVKPETASTNGNAADGESPVDTSEGTAAKTEGENGAKPTTDSGKTATSAEDASDKTTGEETGQDNHFKLHCNVCNCTYTNLHEHSNSESHKALRNQSKQVGNSNDVSKPESTATPGQGTPVKRSNDDATSEPSAKKIKDKDGSGKEVYHCEVCNLVVLQPQDYTHHLQGKKHLIALQKSKGKSHCEVCHLFFDSETSLYEHFDSEYHKKAVAGKKSSSDNRQLFCDICTVTSQGQKQFNQHLESKRHKKLMGERGVTADGEGFNNAKYMCKVCVCKMESEADFNVHLAGDAHQAKVLAESKQDDIKKKWLYVCNACNYFTNDDTQFSLHMNRADHKTAVVKMKDEGRMCGAAGSKPKEALSRKSSDAKPSPKVTSVPKKININKASVPNKAVVPSKAVVPNKAVTTPSKAVVHNKPNNAGTKQVVPKQPTKPGNAGGNQSKNNRFANRQGAGVKNFTPGGRLNAGNPNFGPFGPQLGPGSGFRPKLEFPPMGAYAGGYGGDMREIPGDYRGDFHGDFRREARGDVREFGSDIRGDLHGDRSNSMRGALHVGLHNEMRDVAPRDVHSDMRRDLRDHVQDIRGDLHSDLRNDIRGDLRSDMRGDIRGDLRSDVKGDIRADLRTDMRGDIRGDLRSNMRGRDLHSDMADVRGDVRGDLRSDLRGDLRGEYHSDVRGDVRRDVLPDYRNYGGDNSRRDAPNNVRNDYHIGGSDQRAFNSQGNYGSAGFSSAVGEFRGPSSFSRGQTSGQSNSSVGFSSAGYAMDSRMDSFRAPNSDAYRSQYGISSRNTGFMGSMPLNGR